MGGGEAIRLSGSSTSAQAMRVINTGADVYFGVESSAAGGFFTGALAYSSVIYSGTAIQNIIGGVSRMIITTGGNVGIGTTAPNQRLHISDTTNGFVGIRLEGSGTYSGSDFSIFASSDPASSANDFLGFYNNSTTDSATAGYKMTINKSGNVGIGTVGPNDLLQLQSTSDTAYDPTSDTGQYGFGTGITITNMDTTPQSFSQVNMQVSSSSGRALGRIVTICMASATSDMAFVTENANVKAEKMRIAASGKVTISSTITGTGTILDVSSGRSFFAANGEQYAIGARFNSTGGAVYFGATSGSATPDAQISSAGGGPLMTLKNSGVIQFNNAIYAAAGTLMTDGAGNISTTSDERLKTIDGNFTAGLNEVLQIKPILYHWNELSQLDTENMYAGFSAQNIQSVIPVAAMAQKDTGYLSLQDRPIIAALVNSIKELEARIKILELK